MHMSYVTDFMNQCTTSKTFVHLLHILNHRVIDRNVRATSVVATLALLTTDIFTDSNITIEGEIMCGIGKVHDSNRVAVQSAPTLQVLLLLQPLLHGHLVALQPANLGLDGIKALREIPVEAFGALALKELLDIA